MDKLLCSYDESDIYESELELRVNEYTGFLKQGLIDEIPSNYLTSNESNNRKEINIEAIKEDIDSDVYTITFDNFKECLSEIMDDIKLKDGYFWYIEGKGMGWMDRAGYKLSQSENGSELLRDILPHADCTIEVYKGRGKSIDIVAYHHDSPTGETYNVKAVSEAKYFKLNK